MSTILNASPSPGIWTTKTPFQFPVPNPEDEAQDPWCLLAEEKHAELEERVNIWKDDIQILLTFTGLFSAAVVGFLATTYQALSANPIDTTNALLLQIASRLDSPSGFGNSTSVPMLTASPPFTPPISLVRVHTFWFLSLAISLSTAVISILCLQWIREQQRLPSPGQGRNAFVMFSIRMESFDRWHIPAIIAYLPTSLQIALVLFFVGMIYFVLPLGKEISIPTIAVISVTFLFLIYTTAAPTIQVIYHLLLPKIAKKQYPCPYRSPQSWRLYILAQIIFAGVLILWFFALFFVGFIMILFLLPLGIYNRVESVQTGIKWFQGLGLVFYEAGSTAKQQILYMVPLIFRASSHDWYMTDIVWLRSKNPFFPETNSSGVNEAELRQREWYYAMQGLSSISTLNPAPAHAVYCCTESIPRSVSKSGKFPKAAFPALVADPYNANISTSRVLNSWTDPEPELCHAEYQMLAINMFQGVHNSTFGLHLSIHQLEIYIRILGVIFAGPKWLTCAPGTQGLSIDTFTPRLLRPHTRRLLPSIIGGDQCLQQLVLIWASFVTNLLACDPSEIPLGRYHRSTDIEALNNIVAPAFYDFLDATNEIMSLPTPCTLDSIKTFTKIHRMLTSFIGHSLRNAMTGEPYQTGAFPIIWSTVYRYLVSCLGKDTTLTEDSHSWGRVPLKLVVFDQLSQRLADSGGDKGIIQDYVSSFKGLFQLADALIEAMVDDEANSLDDVDFLHDYFSAKHRLDLLKALGMNRMPRLLILARLPMMGVAPASSPSPTNILEPERETPSTTAPPDSSALQLVPTPPDDSIPVHDTFELATFMAKSPINSQDPFLSEAEVHGEPTVSMYLAAPTPITPPSDAERTDKPEHNPSTNESTIIPPPLLGYPTPLHTPDNPKDAIIDVVPPFLPRTNTPLGASGMGALDSVIQDSGRPSDIQEARLGERKPVVDKEAADEDVVVPTGDVITSV